MADHNLHRSRVDEPGDSRRSFLRYLAVLGAGAMLPTGRSLGQDRSYTVTAPGGSIDVHHHFSPPTAGGGGRGGGSAAWTPGRSIEQMDRFGIATAMLSMTQRGNALYDGTESGRAAVRTCNDYGAKMVTDYPGRFGLFASVPLPDIEGSLREVEYAYDTLKCDGIGIYTNDNHGRWPGDPHFQPLWQELNRRRAVVYVHPWVPECCVGLNYGAAPFMAEVDFETTRAITSIIANGVMFRYPNVTLITVHAGGTLPVLAGRMQDRWPADGARYIPNGLAAELRKLYYDVAHATFAMPIAALLQLVPPTQLLFGTDYFPEGIETTVNEIPKRGLSREVVEMIERRNAERLFPRLQA